jgi:hypothetical protein
MFLVNNQMARLAKAIKMIWGKNGIWVNYLAINFLIN